MANEIKLIRQGAGDALFFNTEVVASGQPGADYPVTSEGIAAAISGAVDSAKDFILLKSSTEESEKVFKITVDDDGELTATEVTEEE